MKSVYVGHLILHTVIWATCAAFDIGATTKIQKLLSLQLNPLVLTNQCRDDINQYYNTRPILYSTKVSTDNDEDEDVVEPGMMRVSEIKAELDLRAVSYADCFDKESLVQRLVKARKEGIADPAILDQFNKQNLEKIFRGDTESGLPKDITDSDIDAAIANDGTIPGGLTPDQFKKLISSPEVMAALSNTKMQEAMRLRMEGKSEEVEKMIQEDSELREMAKTIASVIGF